MGIKTNTSCSTIRLRALPSDYSNVGIWIPANFKGKSSEVYQGLSIWTDGDNTYYSREEVQLVLNGDTWETKTWSGLTSFNGYDVWTDGDNIYYQLTHILNKETSTWETKTWEGFTGTTFRYDYLWTDGSNIYFSAPSVGYILNKETSTWEAKTWKYNNGSNIHTLSLRGDSVWSDGTNFYYNVGGSDKAYILNKETGIWEIKTWNTSLNGGYVWSDGANVYYSTGYDHNNNGLNQKFLNTETGEWEVKEWGGNSDMFCPYIWSDGKHIYYSDTYDAIDHWVLLTPAARLYTKLSDSGSWVELGALCL